MKPLFFCPIWGLEDLPLSESLAKIKRAGYDGAEIALNPDTQDLKAIKQLFVDFDLVMLAQHPFAKGDSPASELTDYTAKLEQILLLEPFMVNCHTGRDYWEVADNIPFIEKSNELSEKSGIPIVHEIHRGRFGYATMVMKKYMEQLKELPLTADFSHWCVVSESLLEEQEGFMKTIVPFCHHIHARVGDAQSPQVTHPNTPENKQALDAHLTWWKQIYKYQQSQGANYFPVTCEFGPMPYLPSLPFTNVAVADAWEINLFMKDLLTEKIKEWSL